MFDSVYVDLKYDEISLTSTAGTGHVGLWVGSWPSNRTTRDRLPSELRDPAQECREQNFDWH